MDLISLTPFRIETLGNDVHPLNALVPIVVTLSHVIVVNLVNPMRLMDVQILKQLIIQFQFKQIQMIYSMDVQN